MKTLTKQIILYCCAGLIAVALALLWFLFCAQEDLFLDSVSDVGGKYDHFGQFVALGSCYVAYCIAMGLFALRQYGYTDKIAKIAYVIGWTLFWITCIIPYDKDCMGVLAGFDKQLAITLGDIHNLLARISLGVLLTTLIYFVVCLFWRDKKVAIATAVTLGAVVIVAIILIVIHGTCSIAECILQGYMALLLFALPFAHWIKTLRQQRETDS